jgi:hypothetical protein
MTSCWYKVLERGAGAGLLFATFSSLHAENAAATALQRGRAQAR